MSMNDLISDALARMRNAYRAKKDSVDIKASGLMEKLCEILNREGYIDNYKRIEDNRQGIIKVYLKYHQGGKPALQHIKRISSGGRRKYLKKQNVKRVLQGFGLSILATSKGVLTDQ